MQSLVETVHILLKMLEKYSKSKAFMVVRRRKKNKQAKSGVDDGDILLLLLDIYIILTLIN